MSINRYYGGWYIFQGRIDKRLKALNRDVEELYRRHKKPIIVTEFGVDVISRYYYDPPQTFSEEYQAELVEETIKLLNKKDFVVENMFGYLQISKLHGVLEGQLITTKEFLQELGNPN